MVNVFMFFNFICLYDITLKEKHKSLKRVKCITFYGYLVRTKVKVRTQSETGHIFNSDFLLKTMSIVGSAGIIQTMQLPLQNFHGSTPGKLK